MPDARGQNSGSSDVACSMELTSEWVSGCRNTSTEKMRRLRSAEAPRARYWPVPVNSIVCSPPEPLSETTTAPVLSPVALGAKVTEIVQLALGASDDGQVFL
jgi:hypothetical protein